MFSLFKRQEPELGRVRIEPFGKEITVPKEQSILQAALDAGLPFPHSCKVGTCMTCRSLLRSGAVKPIRDFSYVLSGEELQAGYILACQAKVKPGEKCVLEIDVEADAPRHRQFTVAATLTGKKHLAHDIIELRLRSNGFFPYTAGQYAELKATGFDRGRAYSFASKLGAGGSQEFRFFVRKIPGGDFTTWLFETAQVGDSIELNGPFGNFWLRSGIAPLVCIAGGSGLAPLISILQAAAESQVKRELALLFGARTQRDLYALDEIKCLASSWPAKFTFIPVLSDEPEGSDWSGLRGLVTQALTQTQIPDLALRHAYLCGPPPMIDAAILVLNQVGVDHRHIHYDKFLDASDLARAEA
ncbi:2Fe-2S iron-sulfur cluster-binding protein [Polycyclovorans algicola]|uniref:2Fe-2S iron-sulfur cluster-binding protein n=1 Tax=Polycyclovorans algicola TaxID=616992 RepID=UPI0004A70416|nr:2Fe-2S iron-sulfur cluster binding domain-containing protein [Polycyclovorans algicola]